MRGPISFHPLSANEKFVKYQIHIRGKRHLILNDYPCYFRVHNGRTYLNMILSEFDQMNEQEENLYVWVRSIEEEARTKFPNYTLDSAVREGRCGISAGALLDSSAITNPSDLQNMAAKRLNIHLVPKYIIFTGDHMYLQMKATILPTSETPK